MYNEETQFLKSDNDFMEFVLETRNNMTNRDKLHYVDSVLEAVISDNGRANIMNKLFRDLQKIDGIDFGKIPDSKGDITKYVHYQQFVTCIESLEMACDKSDCGNLPLLKKLHQIMLQATPDFKYGFMTDNFVIISLYKVLVGSFYELIEICSLDVTQYLREKLGSKEKDEKVTAKNNSVVSSVEKFVKQYESGQWATTMKLFRANPQATLGSNTAPAIEAINVNVSAEGIGKGLDMFNDKKFFELASKLAEPFKNIFNKTPKGIKITAGIIAGLITLLVIIRKLIFFYFASAFKIEKFAKNNAEILKAEIAINGDAPGIKKQQKWLDRFERTADNIKYKVFKAEKTTNALIAKADRDNLSVSAIKSNDGEEFII